nr:unnamed protein product [Callosobruchus analis]
MKTVKIEKVIKTLEFSSQMVKLDDKICDSDLNILNLDATFGGATHDAYIWRNSDAYRHLRELHNHGETAWFLARNTVERCIGLLKARWRCLLVHRVLHYDPHMVAKIINACAVLHNLCNRNQTPAPAEYIHVEANREVTVQAQGMLADANEALLLERGQQQRATIIQRLWHARGE